MDQAFMTTIKETAKLRALLVEDSPMIQKVHLWILEKLGFEVDVAESVKTARQLFDATLQKGQRYHMALMDFGLPDGEGTEIIQLLKKHDNETIVVVVTACVSAAVINSCHHAGSDLVLNKPIQADNLKRQIQTLRDRKHKSAV
jgi:DNA-binding response OmpR family regulator